MSTYRITREIDSAAYFPAPVTLAGITFVTPGNRESATAHASGQWEAAEFRKALVEWEARLKQLLDAIAVGPGAGLSTYGGSILIEKQGATVAFFQRLVIHNEVVTLTEFAPAQLDVIHRTMARLESDPRIGVTTLNYRESLLYKSALVSTVHLLRALEVLAGKVARMSKCSNCSNEIRCATCGTAASWPATDRAELERMLGTASYDYFYRKPGARNLIMHGSYVDQNQLREHTQVLREAVQAELWSAVAVPEKAAFRPALPAFAYTAYPRWIETEGREVTLEQLVNMHATNQLHFLSSPRLMRQDEIDALRRNF